MEIVLAPTSADAAKLYTTGKAIFDSKTFAAGVPLIEQAAELGHPQAMYMLGKCYLYKHAKPYNLKLAIKCLQKAFDAGVTRAGYFLYRAYSSYQTPAMDKKAFAICLTAAEIGDALSQLQTGKNYNTGFATKPDADKATFWLKRAAASGNTEAVNILRPDRRRPRQERVRKAAMPKARSVS